MPSMSMPDNTIMLKPVGNGDFKGVCTFSMSGIWAVVAHVDTPAGDHGFGMPVSVP
jgi:hypothetical protein